MGQPIYIPNRGTCQQIIIKQDKDLKQSTGMEILDDRICSAWLIISAARQNTDLA